MAFEKDLNLDVTELRLGLPGTSDESAKNQTPATLRSNNKRALPEESLSSSATASKNCDQETAPLPK